MIEIRVVNLKNVGTRANLIRIDRSTPYGNRHRINLRVDRVEAIRRFEVDIDQKPLLVERLMKEVLLIAEEHMVVYLGCHCKPEPCHGDILKRLLQERLS